MFAVSYLGSAACKARFSFYKQHFFRFEIILIALWELKFMTPTSLRINAVTLKTNIVTSSDASWRSTSRENGSLSRFARTAAIISDGDKSVYQSSRMRPPLTASGRSWRRSSDRERRSRSISINFPLLSLHLLSRKEKKRGKLFLVHRKDTSFMLFERRAPRVPQLFQSHDCRAKNGLYKCGKIAFFPYSQKNI